MNPWRARLAWTAAALSFASMTGGTLIRLAYGQPFEDVALFIPVTLGTFAMCSVGALVASRTRNPLGWLLIAIPASLGVSLIAGEIRDAMQAGATTPSLLVLAWVTWLATWPFLLSLALLIAVFYLFPSGRLPSPRWRWPWRAYVSATVATAVGFAVKPFGEEELGSFPVANPVEISAIGGVLGPILGVAGGMVVLSAFAAFASLVGRYRKAGAEERQQMRWLFLVGSIGAFLFLTLLLTVSVAGDADVGAAARFADVVMVLLVSDVVIGIPVATGIAIFRYHLYDLGIVVRKTVVYALLAIFITAVYVAVVVGIGVLVDDQDSTALSVAATAVVAVLFQPARERAERFAARLVYGERATPYEVMAGFSERVARSVSVDHVLPDMAAAAGDGVGAVEASVRVFLSDERERVERWTREDIDGVQTAPAQRIPIAYHGNVIGEVDITKPAAEPLSTAEEKLLTDLVGQAGLALHNVRLTEELALRVAELDEQAVALRASRERLVTARDAQRRGLQRDLHEGPERTLVSIRQQLAAAEAAGPIETATLLDRQIEHATATLEGLRDLARGIFPPLLAEAGVVPALEAHIRKVGASERVETAEGFAAERFDPDLEACIYFCCLQVIQNVLRHAGNAPCTVRLDHTSDEITFSIEDAGPGYDAARVQSGMGLAIVKDRVDALDGSLAIESETGSGTSVRIRLPSTSEVTMR